MSSLSLCVQLGERATINQASCGGAQFFVAGTRQNGAALIKATTTTAPLTIIRLFKIKSPPRSDRETARRCPFGLLSAPFQLANLHLGGYCTCWRHDEKVMARSSSARALVVGWR